MPIGESYVQPSLAGRAARQRSVKVPRAGVGNSSAWRVPEAGRRYHGGMDIFFAGALVDLFDIQAFVGLVLLAAVIGVVAVAALRERRARELAHGDEELQP